MSDPPEPRVGGRRRLTRRTLLGTSAALTTAAAGCLSLDGDGQAAAQEEGDDEGLGEVDLLEVVPADATTLSHLQSSDLDEDEYDRLLDEVEPIETGEIEVGAAFPALADQTGLDPWETNELLAFDGADEEDTETDGDGDDDDDAGTGNEDDDASEAGDEEEEEEDELGRYLLDADWDEAELLERVEDETDADYTVTEYEGEDVLYEPGDAADDAILVGVLGDGQYVLGRREDVTAALDVRFADEETLSGQVVEAFEDVRGADLSVAGEQEGPIVPEEYRDFVDFEAIETISRSYDLLEDGEDSDGDDAGTEGEDGEGTDDGGDAGTGDGDDAGADDENESGVDLGLFLWTDDAQAAEDVEADLYGVLSFLRQLAEDEDTRAALQEVEIGRDENVVEVRYQGDLEHVESLLGEI